VLQKLHRIVKEHIFSELAKRVSRPARPEQSSAAHNISYCYIEGLGVDADLTKGIELLREAAEAGSSAARRQHLNIATARRRLQDLTKESFLNWIPGIIEERDRQCLSILHHIDHEAYRRQRQAWIAERTPYMDLAAFDRNLNVQSIPDMRARTCTKEQLLHVACAIDRVELVKDILRQDPQHLESLNGYGQTPLIVACQAGNFNVAQYLLQQAANLATQDTDGISALHWLISFQDAEKAELAPSIYSSAPSPNPMSLNRHGASPPQTRRAHRT
jgi:hypothetical protein